METVVDDDFAPLSVQTEGCLTPCELIIGPAGTGKTYTIKQRIAADENYAVLAASTGIAGVNLSATTVHSLLGFYDLDSLQDSYRTGKLQRRLRKLMEDGTQRIVVDEVSMISAAVLDLLMLALDDVNAQPPVTATGPLGLVLVGDFCQLPPIAEKAKDGGRRARGSGGAPWAFHADCWHRFEAPGALTRLNVNYRQSDPEFLRALNAARAGAGEAAALSLARCNVQFHSALDTEFDGTTILAKNDEVDNANRLRLLEFAKASSVPRIAIKSKRWAKSPVREWERNIPVAAEMCVGAYVMLLANQRETGGPGAQLVYANGDCGHIVSFGQPAGTVQVRLVRTGAVVNVAKLVRDQATRDKPDGWSGETVDDGTGQAEYREDGRPYYRKRKGVYVTGQVTYFPIRLAWASTVHKSQGLTLDRVQVDYRQGFFGTPAMVYTALSRCRTPEGLRLVGDRETFVARCRVDAAVRRWL